MAEPRRYPGEDLVERLWSRRGMRMRVGVSSAFWARFGLSDPWAFDQPPWPGDPRRGGLLSRLDRGALGSFWHLLSERIWRHLRMGVIFGGGLGSELDSGWAEWLPFLQRSAPGWLWDERRFAALARMPGSAFGRRRSPWGAFTMPAFVFAEQLLEEEEPEQPRRARRFRRRRRRRRPQVQAVLPRAIARRPAVEPALPQVAPARPRPLAPARTAVQRVLARQVEPAVGGPVLRRASFHAAASSPVLPRRPASEPYLPSTGAARPVSLLAPLAWAEARVQQADFEQERGLQPSRARPAGPSPRAAFSALLRGTAPGARASLPPSAGRPMRPVLARSPFLAFVTPVEDEPEAEAVEPARRRRRPSRVRRARPPRVSTEPVPSPLAPSRPAAIPADEPPIPARTVRPDPGPASRIRAAARLTPPGALDPPSLPALPSERVAQRLVRAQARGPVAELHRQVRSVVPRPAGRAPLLGADPVERAQLRMPVLADPALPPAARSERARRSLDHLFARPLATPGLPGRVQRWQGPQATVGMQRATARTALPPTLFGLRSPLLSFLDLVEEAEAEIIESAAQRPRARRRPRRRAAAADPSLPEPTAAVHDEPLAALPGAPERRVPAAISRQAAPAPRAIHRPVLRAATRALLRAGLPAQPGGTAIPRPVARLAPDTLLPRLSAAAFPGREQVEAVQPALRRHGLRQPAAFRSMRVPWLPTQVLALPEQLEAQEEAAPAVQRRPRRRVEARRRTEREARPVSPVAPAAAPSVARPAAPPAAAPRLRASARAAARLAELAPQPVAARSGEIPVSHAAPRAVSAVAVAPPAAARYAAPQVPVSMAAPRPSASERAIERVVPTGAPAAVPLAQQPAAVAGLLRALRTTGRAPATLWLQLRASSPELAAALPVQALADPSRLPPAAVEVLRRLAGPSVARSPVSAGPLASLFPAPTAAAAPWRGAFPALATPSLVLPIFQEQDLHEPEPAAAPRARRARPERVEPLPTARPTRAAPPAGRVMSRLQAPGAALYRPMARAAALEGLAPEQWPESPAAVRARRSQLIAAPGVTLQDPTLAEPAAPAVAARPRVAAALPVEPTRRAPGRALVPGAAPAAPEAARAPAARRRGIRPAAPTPRAAARTSRIDALLSRADTRSLARAIARAERPDEVLQVVLERSFGWTGSGAMPTPLRRFVEQVRQATKASPQATPLQKPSARAIAQEPLRRARRPQRRRVAATPLTSPAAPTVHHVQANYRITGLMKKLEQLIHLVDVEHNLAAARAQVRMAEDSAAARAEGATTPGEGGDAEQAGKDLDALVSHIVEFVSEEMNNWSMRRPEAAAQRDPWW